MGSLAMSPAPAPVALDEVKAFLRAGHNGEDGLIAGFIRSATATCEAFTGLALIERAAAEMMQASPRWARLGLTPVRSIEAVEALAPDGTATPLGVDGYAVDIDASGDGWVRVFGHTGRVRVSFTAGLAADWNGVPEPLRQGIVRLAAHLYAARGESEGPPPASVAALWRPWRRTRLA